MSYQVKLISKFQPTYHRTRLNHLRCFPHCCEPMHMERTFCGNCIQYEVNDPQQVGGLRDLQCYWEFVRGSAPDAALTLGKTIADVVENPEECAIKRTHRDERANLSRFSIVPARKWKIGEEREELSKEAPFTLVMYFTDATGKIVQVEPTPTFVVTPLPAPSATQKRQQQQRKLMMEKPPTTMMTTAQTSNQPQQQHHLTNSSMSMLPSSSFHQQSNNNSNSNSTSVRTNSAMNSMMPPRVNTQQLGSLHQSLLRGPIFPSPRAASYLIPPMTPTAVLRSPMARDDDEYMQQLLGAPLESPCGMLSIYATGAVDAINRGEPFRRTKRLKSEFNMPSEELQQCATPSHAMEWRQQGKHFVFE